VFDAEHAGPAVPGHHRDATELATLNPETTFTADSTPFRSTGRRA
jgi:ArsR family transcriptional regulator